MSYAYYFLQVNIYLILFYIFYRLVLHKETFFILNRLYLVCSGLLSLVIPFLRAEWFTNQPATQQIKTSIVQLNTVFTEVVIVPAEVPQFSWWQLMAVVYMLGVLFFTIRFIILLISVQRLIKTQRTGMAFSFFNKKVVDNNLPYAHIINKHEESHIRHMHSLDIVFFELLNSMFWCNPVIYLYKRAIRNIHEFYADEVAARYLGDKESYAMLLLSKAFGVDQNILTNTFFNQSLIKKRICMLYQNRSAKIAILKYGLCLPLFALTLFLSSATVANNSELKAVAAEISRPVPLPASLPAVISNSIPESIAKKQPKAVNGGINGDWSRFYRHLSRTLQYTPQARQQNLQGNSVVNFTIKNGAVIDLKVHTPLGEGCDEQVMKSVLSYDYLSSINDGKYSLKVLFKITSATTPLINEKFTTSLGYTPLDGVSVVATGEETILYDFAGAGIQVQPEFKGGAAKFYRYLIDNFKYPADDIEKGREGRMILSFMVEPTGEVTNVRAEQNFGYSIDVQAIKLLENCPPWSAGIQHGKKVKVKYTIPLYFSINNEKVPALIPGQFKLVGVVGKTSVPLYVLDGNKLSDRKIIMPRDLLSLTILSEEEAIKTFGSEGKNGAVVMITKK